MAQRSLGLFIGCSTAPTTAKARRSAATRPESGKNHSNWANTNSFLLVGTASLTLLDPNSSQIRHIRSLTKH